MEINWGFNIPHEFQHLELSLAEKPYLTFNQQKQLLLYSLDTGDFFSYTTFYS